MIAKLLAHLGELLVHLGGRAIHVWPIEADARRAILKSMRAMERREIRRKPLLDRRALPRLHLLPWLAVPTLVEVRVAALHLGDQAARHVPDIERAALLRDHGMKQDLKKNVAELLLHL